MRPDPPSNITEGDTVIEDGRVAVTVHWSPPANSDLPVSRFKVTEQSETINCNYIHLVIVVTIFVYKDDYISLEFVFFIFSMLCFELCQIYWSKRLKTVSVHLQNLKERRKTVSGLRTSYQLIDLDPDTTYFIQVMT